VTPAFPAGRPTPVPSAARRAPRPPAAAPGPAPRSCLDHAPHRRIWDEGPDRLSTPDLLEVLLGGAPPLLAGGEGAAGGAGASGEAGAGTGPGRGRRADEAWAVLERFESLRRVAAGSVAELAAAGLSADGAVRVAAAFALGRRAAGEGVRRGAPFATSADIFERYHPLLRDARRERFLTVLLDGKNRVMRDEWVSEGSLTSSLVHPREVFARAIRESAGAVVFVHNHPSGDPEPSPEDVEVTRRLCSAGEIVGIRVLDHVVIGEAAYVSFLDRGWLGP
jgi:DNA repair protein RadC